MRYAITAIAVAIIVAPATANAQEAGCYTGEYLGLPIEVCPVPEPDPTNCYDGWYQGAPIEICLPTGEQLPEGTTYNGQPVEYHVSKDYVAPSLTTFTAPSSAPTWLDELQSVLVASGGW